jgi:nitric oxide reductase NorD protein
MEEHVGRIWDRLVTRAAERRYPAAAVTLEQVARTVGVLFRALGGDGGLRVEAANATEHGARRTWLQRLAGSNREVELSWRDEQALRLPAVIECFPEAELNRDLYLWLAALASQDSADAGADWFVHNQRLTLGILRDFPGMRARYQRLVSAHIDQRPDPGRLPGDQAERERAIRAALQHPGSRARLPDAKRAPQPVVLWRGPGADYRAHGEHLYLG